MQRRFPPVFPIELAAELRERLLAELKELGMTYAELEAEAATKGFRSDAARRAWVVYGDLDLAVD